MSEQISELPFNLTAVPITAPLWEYTLVISGGAPNGKAVPIYYSETLDYWLNVFDPQVIPFIPLDANGEATFIFKSSSDYFLTVPFKVLGKLAETPNGGFNPLLLIGVVAAVAVGAVVIWKVI